MSRPSLFSALVLPACAQAPATATAVVPPQPADDAVSPSHCDASKAVDAIGQPPLAEVVEAARKAASAEIVRTLRQGQPSPRNSASAG